MAVTRGRPIIVAASTHPGEEEILARGAPDAGRILSVAADRDRAAASRSRRGDRAHDRRRPACTPALRSREELPTATTDIYVADTMGELGLFYRLAPIVFMGGSLVAHGGQNPIEAIKLGASIVHGPHVFNFTDVYEALDQRRRRETGRHPGSAGEAARPVAGRSRRRAKRRSPPPSAWSNSSAARWSARWPRSSRICCSCGSRWEPRMREPAFWHRPVIA